MPRGDPGSNTNGQAEPDHFKVLPFGKTLGRRTCGEPSGLCPQGPSRVSLPGAAAFLCLKLCPKASDMLSNTKRAAPEPEM